MNRVFPIYKGKDLSKMGVGYSNVKSARKFMDSTKVVKDFDKSLPENYWNDFLYTYLNDTTHPKKSHNVCTRRDIIIYDYDIKKQIFVKDIDNEDIKKMYIELFSLYNILYYKRNLEQENRLVELATKISELGYYPYVWKNDNDYKRKLSKFITNNVQFVEKEVEITIK